MDFRVFLRWRRNSARSRRAIFALAATMAALLVSVPLFSQVNQGTIQGSVFDQTGGAIGGPRLPLPTRLEVPRER